MDDRQREEGQKAGEEEERDDEEENKDNEIVVFRDGEDREWRVTK